MLYEAAQQQLLGRLPAQADFRVERVAEVAVVVIARRQRQIEVRMIGNREFGVTARHVAAAAGVAVRVDAEAVDQFCSDGGRLEAGLLLPLLGAERHRQRPGRHLEKILRDAEIDEVDLGISDQRVGLHLCGIQRRLSGRGLRAERVDGCPR